MSSKAYSPEEREAVRSRLLETALALYSKHGIREVRLSDILEVVGISKPFFYKFFDSVAVFVIEVLNFQWEHLSVLLDELEHESNGCWRDKMRFSLDCMIHHRKHGLLVMTQEEEVWVRGRLSDELFDKFMATQSLYFAELLRRWEISSEKCDPKVFTNMVLTIIITYNSAQQALPFLYLDELERTAKAQTESLLLYLENLKEPAQSRN